MRLAAPLLDAEELEEVGSILETGFLTQGPKAAEFENEVSSFVEVPYAVATSSCTTALHLALVSLGVGAGDEVVIPDFTFPATANAVLQIGARPVVVDIDVSTYNIDVEQVDSVISARTKAIMPVHAFGLCADMDPLVEISRSHAIPVVEDAACALGASYKGRMAGSLGDVACLSFHPRKVVTTGEGGMLLTSDPETFEKARLLSTHGGQREDLYMSFIAAGFNYRLSDVHAAIGVAQMRKLTRILERRRELALAYSRLLEAVLDVSVPIEPREQVHAFQSYVVLLADSIDRDEVIREMRKEGIETTLGTYSLSLQPYFAHVRGKDARRMPNSARAFRQSLSLPLHPGMTQSDVVKVVVALLRAIRLQGFAA